jgi:hypothetical protein
LVKKQELMLWDASLLQPSPDMITFKLNSTITVPKPFTVVLDPLNMSLFIRDSEEHQPYAYLLLPKVKLHGNATIDLPPQRTRLVNQTQWLTFLNASVYSEELTLAAKGKTTGHFGKLKASLTLDKDIRIKGWLTGAIGCTFTNMKQDSTDFKGSKSQVRNFYCRRTLPVII